MIIAIDGPAAAGKSTVARMLAERLGFTYIDTGAMYRAATFVAMKFGIDFDNGAAIVKKFRENQLRFESAAGGGQRVFLGDEEITDAIRTPELTRNIKPVCAQPEVRAEMTELQRRMGRSGDSVLEGRDIGTVVFPGAEAKFYLDAEPEVRARRRMSDLEASEKKMDFERLVDEIRQRDESDMNRLNAPLKKAEDAEYVDTSNMTIEEVVDRLAVSVDKHHNETQESSGD